MDAAFIFDIDHTLYPHSALVEKWFCDTIDKFLMETQKLTPEEARNLRIKYYNLFGSTLPGLLYFHDVRAQDYIAHNDNMPMDILDRDEAALDKIRQATARKLAVTNSNRRHGERVLEHLGLDASFENFYGIENMGFWGKPFRKGFDLVFQDANIDYSKAVFFEDTPRNLAYPKHLGMTTILINAHSVEPGRSPDYVDHHVANLSDAMDIALGL